MHLAQRGLDGLVEPPEALDGVPKLHEAVQAPVTGAGEPVW